MSDNKSVVLNAAGKNVELPVHTGTLGAPCVDIGRLPKETGYFTYDPGFVATANQQNLERLAAEVLRSR